MILQNVRLFDGTGKVQDSTTIQIEGDRIKAVGNVTRERPGEEVLDLSGKTVMPGLINCHTHLCHDGSPNPHAARQGRSFTEIVLVAAEHAACTLRAGITMVRDMGGYQWIDLGLKVGPATIHAVYGYQEMDAFCWNGPNFEGEIEYERQMYGISVPIAVAKTFIIRPEVFFYDWGEIDIPTWGGINDIPLGDEIIGGIQFQIVF